MLDPQEANELVTQGSRGCEDPPVLPPRVTSLDNRKEKTDEIWICVFNLFLYPPNKLIVPVFTQNPWFNAAHGIKYTISGVMCQVLKANKYISYLTIFRYPQTTISDSKTIAAVFQWQMLDIFRWRISNPPVGQVPWYVDLSLRVSLSFTCPRFVDNPSC